MTPAYWDRVAADYAGQVVSVFDCDTAELVVSRIRAAGEGRADQCAADLGCGVGKFTPALARAFGRVEACDWSVTALESARAACVGCGNVGFHRVDLAADALPFAPVDFVLCVNVLLMPSLDQRMCAWRTVTNQVAQGGTLLLVVPALESVLFEQFQSLEARLHAGETCAEALAGTVPARAAVAELHQGVHRLEGVGTKHYLREELEQTLRSHEFDVVELRRLEYPVAQRGAWDWLVTARRR